MHLGGNIQLRRGQSADMIADDENVKVFAPQWVEEALKELAVVLKGARFQIEGRDDLVIGDEISLTDLVAIARNESYNVTGIINQDCYSKIEAGTILTLRDLVKHCVIVGKDVATQVGGYPQGSSTYSLNKEVYICDLPALQFQRFYNSGRHVLIFKEEQTLRDDLKEWVFDYKEYSLNALIFRSTVGENKLTYNEALQNKTGRFLSGCFLDQHYKFRDNVLFDTQAFEAFVAQDFLLAARALNAQAKLGNDQLNFKFLKYGTGFFADSLHGEAKIRLSENLARGVLLGVKQLFKLPKEDRSQIKRIELPFYYDSFDRKVCKILEEISVLCQKEGVEFDSTNNDALAQTSQYITATTNCSDPHAPTGNEMGYASVDAAIAENLKGKANKFNPILNKKMKAEYLMLNCLLIKELNDDNIRGENSDDQQEFSHFWSASNSRKGEPRSYLPGIVWSTIAATVVGLLVKTNQVIRLGLPSSWRAALGAAAAFFVVLQGIFARNAFKDRQYDEYICKFDKEINAFNPNQQAAFNAGVKSAEDNTYYYIGSWRPYLLSPGAFYAGLKAQQLALQQDFGARMLVRERLARS